MCNRITWRAEGGYQTVCNCPKLNPYTFPPYFGPGMPSEIQRRQPRGQAQAVYPTEYVQPPPYFVAGPVPIQGLWACQPVAPNSNMVVQPPTYPQYDQRESLPPVPTPPNATSRTKKSPWAPPELDKKNGVSYLFDNKENHTELNVFLKAGAVWKDKYFGQKLDFKRFKVSNNFTFKMAIETIIKKNEDDCKDWAITEVLETGDGNWSKGVTIPYDCDLASTTLKSFGWTYERGRSQPPVWVSIHKKDFKK